MGKIVRPDGKDAEKLPRVLVGVLAGSSIVDSGFAESYPSALIGHGELFWAEQGWIHGGIPDDSRNQIVEYALEHDFDYVFFMDSDQVFPKAALAKLLMAQAQIAMDFPMATVVGGLYVTRSDHRYNVYSWNTEWEGFESVPIEVNTGVHRCDVVATGCQLVDCGIFRDLEYPWFEYWYKPQRKGGKVTKWSEDMVFGKKCYDRGLPHFVHSDVLCPHIHSVLLDPVGKGEYRIRKLSGSLYHDEERSAVDVAEPAEEMSELSMDRDNGPV